MAAKLFAGIDAGGTTFKCIVGTGPHDIRASAQIPVQAPAPTLAACVAFFQEARHQHGPLAALGVGSFGPVDLQPDSPTYGYITQTPKPGWQHTDVLGALRQSLRIPVAFDTDVNAALLGEARWGAGRDCRHCVYITVGTGIGAGAMIAGQLVHGRMHPEAGHMLLRRHPRDDFPGTCPFHRDCAEGLASGPAIAARAGGAGETLPAGHPAFALVAHYLAALCMNLSLCYSPERIILGGGVMARPGLLEDIRHSYRELIGGYLAETDTDIHQRLSAAALGSRAGALGALALAMTQD